MKITAADREFMQSIERGEWREINDGASTILEAQRIAAASTTKTERMNVCISSTDLKAPKARVLKEGLPYQTLVTSVLRKYVSGQLKEVKQFCQLVCGAKRQ